MGIPYPDIPRLIGEQIVYFETYLLSIFLRNVLTQQMMMRVLFLQ